MHKFRVEEVALFLVPLAIVPISRQMPAFQKSEAAEEEVVVVTLPTPMPTATPRPAVLSEVRVTSMLPSRDGRLLYTSGATYNTGFTSPPAGASELSAQPIHIWDARTLRHRGVMGQGKTYPNSAIRLSPDGRTLLYIQNERHSFLIDTRTGKQKNAPRDLDLENAAISNDAFAVGTGEGVGVRSLRDGLSIRDIYSKRPMTRGLVSTTAGGFGLPGVDVEQRSFARSLAFSRDGSLLSWINEPQAFADSEAMICPVSRKRPLLRRSLRNLVVRQAMISGDSSKLVVLADYRVAPRDISPGACSVMLALDTKSGREIYQRLVPGCNAGDLSVSPDGRWAAFVSQASARFEASTRAHIVDLSRGDVVASQDIGQLAPCPTAFSNSRELIVAGSKRRFRLDLAGWKLATA